jgi:glycerophosphoryl diester phosphodiesterase
VHPFFDSPTPHLIAHRGASIEAPENTLLAFERAWATGVPFLETDCHATRDGEIVILHDPEVSRTTDGSGPVRDLSFAEVQRLDAGFRFSTDDGRTFPYRGQGIRIPRLTELLERFPEARVNLEIKPQEASVTEEVVRIVRRAGAEHRMLLASDKDEVLERVRALDAGTALGSTLSDVVAFFQAVREGTVESHQPRGMALQIPPTFMGDPLVTQENVEAAHALGLWIHIWTINDPQEMLRLLECGVDGVMSDDPETLVGIARKHGGAR